MQQLILSIGIFVSAVLAVYFDQAGLSVWYMVFKPLTTALIILLVALNWFRFKTSYALRILAALIFCLIGDSFLLFDRGFVYGLASFFVGHLFILFALIPFGINKKLLTLLPLLLYGNMFFWLLFPNLEQLLIPVALYIVVILCMVQQAFGPILDVKNKFGFLLIAGALLFAFSDSVLAYNKFYAPVPYAGVIILTSYWLAVYLIARSTNYSKT